AQRRRAPASPPPPTPLAPPRQKHRAWKAEVAVAARTPRATATLRFDRGGAPVDLDSRGLVIESVTSPDGGPLRFELGPSEPILGQRLRITLTPGVDSCVVRYRTGPDASALQWLEPEPTAGGEAPVLYSPCQAIPGRPGGPPPDPPRLPNTYRAGVDGPPAAGGRGGGGGGGRRGGRGARGGGARREGRAHPAVPLRLRGGRSRVARARPTEPGVGRAVGGRPRCARVRGRGPDAHLRRGALR